MTLELVGVAVLRNFVGTVLFDLRSICRIKWNRNLNELLANGAGASRRCPLGDGGTQSKDVVVIGQELIRRICRCPKIRRRDGDREVVGSRKIRHVKPRPEIPIDALLITDAVSALKVAKLIVKCDRIKVVVTRYQRHCASEKNIDGIHAPGFEAIEITVQSRIELTVNVCITTDCVGHL